MNRLASKTSALALLLAQAIAFSGCGKQSFQVAIQSSSQAAAGAFNVPAKVDILLAEDDSGSIYEAYDQIAHQLPEFLEELEKRGWDYHFATTPLTRLRTSNLQVVTSKYDGNWYNINPSLWKEPFPGADPTSPLFSIPSQYFREPSNYTDFVDTSEINYGAGSMEPGFNTILKALTVKAQSTGFIRPDAMLVVLAVSNGEDTSGSSTSASFPNMDYCRRSDGYYQPCSGQESSSFNYYQSQFTALKSSASMFRFYSAVAARSQTNCLGSTSRTGTRYQNMATAMRGASYDVCSRSISSVLDSLSGNLQSIKLEFVTRYLVLGEAPKPNTIRVYKYLGGDPNNKVEIPNNATNGWTYDTVNNPRTVYTIESPTPMNQATGYVIELHGSAKLRGNDTPEIEFEPAASNPTP